MELWGMELRGNQIIICRSPNASPGKVMPKRNYWNELNDPKCEKGNILEADKQHIERRTRIGARNEVSRRSLRPYSKQEQNTTRSSYHSPNRLITCSLTICARSSLASCIYGSRPAAAMTQRTVVAAVYRSQALGKCRRMRDWE
jgi:hypothetical protein